MNMKSIDIKIKINEDKVATAIKTNGFDNNNISNQFELMGILENLKNIINERIKKLLELSK